MAHFFKINNTSFNILEFDSVLTYFKLLYLQTTSRQSYIFAVCTQCDQMARLRFRFCPFTTKKLCPIGYIILQK